MGVKEKERGQWGTFKPSQGGGLAKERRKVKHNLQKS